MIRIAFTTKAICWNNKAWNRWYSVICPNRVRTWICWINYSFTRQYWSAYATRPQCNWMNYKFVLYSRFEDGEAEGIRLPENSLRKTQRHRQSTDTAERRKSRRHSTGTSPHVSKVMASPKRMTPTHGVLDEDSSGSTNSAEYAANGVFNGDKGVYVFYLWYCVIILTMLNIMNLWNT